MKERPIIFSGEMVKAVLNGRKTQTRRIVKPQPIFEGMASYGESWMWQRGKDWFKGVTREQLVGPAGLIPRCPYGVAGDRLWVRETFCGPVLTSERGELFERYYYKSTHQHERPRDHKARIIPWKPSIHMPRAASRITLEITKVRVERLQDISEEDAKAEGSYLGRCPCMPRSKDRTPLETMFRQTGCHIHGTEYHALWDSLYGKGAWEKNPWVWVLDFKIA